MAMPPEELYRTLRGRALEEGQEHVGEAPPDHPDVVGAVVDVPTEGGSVTLIALADGTTSMYSSAGSGVVGAGGRPEVVVATRSLLTVVQSILTRVPPDDRMDLPPSDLVQITVLTPAGRHRARVPAEAFWGRQPSSVTPLLAAIHAVISALREATPDPPAPSSEGAGA
ncbi:hypothetical protein HC251_01005 [Iamia sp. SCSIO 61187]|uniref:hypothetical protein n=1 Tax=Iamia sp. SCSIO 61187 TaxID=2722752 RepID=UPI001C63AB1A|nr:hypothetical protein [Iamia sp. SCSIO 61187]QYG91151.1 hypothetical protein HC251_01005 [Iamia sp. SCSIO 61187]